MVMLWFIVGHVFSLLLTWLRLGRWTDQEKDLEILLLQQQLRTVERQAHKPVRLSRIEKLTLAILTVKLKTLTQRPVSWLGGVLRLVQPASVLKWHRDLVRRKWTTHAPTPSGRPRTTDEIESLVVRFVHENPDWGYGKIVGELGKLGHRLSKPTIAAILARHGLPAANALPELAAPDGPL